MAKKQEIIQKIIEKTYDFVFLIQEGGRMDSEVPYKVIKKEIFNGTRNEAKEKEKSLKIEYPEYSIVYFSK